MVTIATQAGPGLSFAATTRRIEAQESFTAELTQEWRRAERSRRPFLLFLFEVDENEAAILQEVASFLAPLTRETDVWGWYKTGRVLGAIFTELGNAPIEDARKAILEKMNQHLQKFIPGAVANITITSFTLPVQFHNPPAYAEDPEYIDSILHSLQSHKKYVQLRTKRILDVIGSAFLLVAMMPFLLLIAIAVKITSRGPALFRQTRVGHHGEHFTFLKFRSMKTGNNSGIHEDYCRQFIHGKAAKHQGGGGKQVFKLTSDPRITPLGKFLRKTSLDELPQLWNVLCGDMSLIGPRPPIPYEVSCYDFWHLRRVLEMKPGLTGLWQISGRNRTTFDEMVRLDLQYARKWSLWLDFRILLETPLTLVNGAH